MWPTIRVSFNQSPWHPAGCTRLIYFRALDGRDDSDAK